MTEYRFMAIVRRHLHMLEATEELPLDAPLRELGLDSMATARLVLELENDLGVALPMTSLTTATFASPRALWAVVLQAMRPR
jgi:acyl carrier protein